ncbi:LytR/AlgR family response regulator transcription factor [Sphingobacterium siyangense]|uniref:LytTR family two component transcriptional regulator n=1 Tax=Sphingobacterium siyangense TaxID=459529 RepID=A0A562MGT4_9SPHI|nr:LytTR family DNA-binding domain-containing protein [Sphingobacterium siyangense]TWI19157.1 LytTR family two component transcriptional regulator [Sphingobacterium siyangense]
MNILIIEDEPLTARELSDMITEIDPNFRVLATLVSIEQSLTWFNQNNQPDLIFSDIQLADGLSFDIFRKLDLHCPIIFCTAFDEYILSAFDTNTVSYLLKPISKFQLEQALNKFKNMQKAFTKLPTASDFSSMYDQLRRRYKSTLLVNQRERIVPVRVKDIAYFWLDNNIVQICTLSHQKYFLVTSMEELETMVDPSLFYRANRQFLINRNAVSDVERFFSRKLAIKMTVESPEVVMVSKPKAVEFLHWLEGIVKLN